MSDDTKPEFDPRFSPAFQRGFDPEAPGEKTAPAAGQRPSYAEEVAQYGRQAVVPGGAPAAVPPAPARVASTPPSVGAVGQPPTALTIAPLEQEVEPEPLPEVPAGRNPFLLTLGIVAVVLVGAGIWLFARSGAAFNSREVRSQGDYMSLDATIHTAPFIALLGAATAIGVLFVYAARWRKRR